MFLNKMKEQQEKNASFAASSASHYQTALLTIPTPGTKTDGGGHVGGVAQLHPPHSNQNMLSVPSTGIMTAGESASLLVYAVIVYSVMINFKSGDHQRLSSALHV